LAFQFSSTPQPPEKVAVDPGAQPSPREGRERILLVDDEEVLRRLARAVLTRHGYRVVDAGSPADAVAIAQAEPDSFDLILADVMMPGMRGYEMVKQLGPLLPRARVLYMSGYVDELDHDKVRPLLPKPFTPSELAARIRAELDAGRPER
jgi:two-component system cell cycle sensor histidine kinase/response regulator CckA